MLGCALVLLSSCVLGIYYSFKIEYRMSDLLEMKKALVLLVSEIEFVSAPLAEAMASISSKVDKPIDKILYDFSDNLGKLNLSAGEVWKRSLEDNIKSTFFEKEDIESFVSFGKTLGYLDRKQQNNNIEITVRYIDAKISELVEKSEKNKKMYKSLGLFGGMVIMVILF